ncbi:DUF3021 domain-containing protein [Paucisalibacillus sp. EB02]|uniref:DUF3021 domain-containing protein n=1 Tax=Paucisalibacillus sp. EB02 TaxID=1347087 RepID=UPI0004BAEA1F|nr:DUF3021 domain-containing protein [Paucisalibacillus sp. EB02]
MIKVIVKRRIMGIAFGGITTFIALTIIKFAHIEQSAAEVWNHMLASFLLGIYFSIASFIYETDKWSPLKKTIIHFTLSITVYFLIALPVGWIPFTPLSIVVGILLFSVLYGLYWVGFLLYFKRIEASMNKQLNQKG